MTLGQLSTDSLKGCPLKSRLCVHTADNPTLVFNFFQVRGACVREMVCVGPYYVVGLLWSSNMLPATAVLSLANDN